MTEGLVADREAARYTDETLRREEPLPAPRPVEPRPSAVAAAPPSPPPQAAPPASSVSSRPIPPPAPAAAQPRAAPPAAQPAPPQPTREQAAANAASRAAPARQAARPAPFQRPTQAAAELPAGPPPPPLSASSLTDQPPPSSGTGAAAPQLPPEPVVSMAPVWSPGDPQPRPSAAQVPANLEWGPPPPDIDIARTAAVPRRGTPASRVAAAEDETGLRVASIQFGSGSAKLDPQDDRVLRQVADLYRQRGGTVVVIGRASSSAAAASSLRLQVVNFSVSLDRAGAVARALERHGVPSGRIEVAAMPDADAAPSAEAANRRADVFLR
jgi:outer membrane protein OmpA-like peptidoglycan-associated protein